MESRMWRKSYWPESQCLSILSTWLFSDHPQGTKEPYRTPAWLSDIWLCVALTKYYFIFGVCDGRQRLKTMYYLFQTILCFLSVTYLLFSYCAFILKVKQKWNWSKSGNTVQIFNLFNESKIDFCHRALALWDWATFELGGCFCVELKELWVMCIMQNLQCNICHHCFICSYSTVKCSIWETSTFMDVQFIKHSAAGKSLFTILFQTFPEKSNQTRKCQLHLEPVAVGWFAGFVQDIKATIHTTQSCLEI